MKLIGISGKARSGKDEFAKILCKTYRFTRIGFADKVKQFGIDYFGLTQENAFDKKTKESRVILQGIGNAARTRQELIFTSKESQPILGVSGLYENWVEKIALEEFGLLPELLVAKKGKLKKEAKTILSGIRDMFQTHLDEFIHISANNPEDVWVKYLLKSCSPNTVYVLSDVRYRNEKMYISSLGGYNTKIVRVDNPDIEAGANHPSETDLDNELEWDFTIINEHKSDWQDRLTQSAANLVRKLDASGFFSEQDKERFKINIAPY